MLQVLLGSNRKCCLSGGRPPVQNPHGPKRVPAARCAHVGFRHKGTGIPADPVERPKPVLVHAFADRFDGIRHSRVGFGSHITEMIERAGRSDSGELDYIWRNPATRKLEHKHTYFRIEGGRLVGVGYYTR